MDNLRAGKIHGKQGTGTTGSCENECYSGGLRELHREIVGDRETRETIEGSIEHRLDMADFLGDETVREQIKKERVEVEAINKRRDILKGLLSVSVTSSLVRNLEESLKRHPGG